MKRRLVFAIAASLVCGGRVCPVMAQEVATTGARSDATARAADELLSRLVTVNVTRVSLKRAIDVAAASAHVLVQYREPVLEAYTKPVTLHLTQVTLRSVLDRLLAETTLRVVPDGTTQLAIVDDKGVGAAKDSGAVSGRVINGKSKAPVAGVSVTLDDSARHTVTDAEGRYHFTGVRAGTHTVRVRTVGFARQSRVVTVGGTETTAVDFALESTVNTLDQVVVTATGEQRYRELGHVVANVNADSLVRNAPITSVAELLTARVPGLQVLTSDGGMAGGEVALRLRGTTTTLDPQPIVIVDGVRYKNTNTVGSIGVSEDRRPFNAEPRSPLNDLNVNDIETVEVVKGPSATTLYGPDAANGVIVITTKRGTSGATEWRVYAHPSLHSDVPDQRLASLTYYQAWGHDPSTGELFSGNCTLEYQYRYHYCVLDSVTVAPRQVTDPDLTVLSSNRPQGQLGASVSGGTGALRYFVSGNYDTQTGPLTLPGSAVQFYQQLHGTTSLPPSLRTPNSQQSVGFHSSVTTDLGGRGGLTLNAMYDQSSQRSVNLSFFQNVFGVGYVTPGADTAQFDQSYGESFTNYTLYSAEAQTRRVTGSLNGNYRLLPWLNATGTLGTDLGFSTDVSVLPTDAAGVGFSGQASDYRRDNIGRTADLGLSAMAKPGRWSFRSSLGVQYSYLHTDGINADGYNLAPGSSSISTATDLTTTQVWNEVAQLGSYGEEVVGLDDRLFLTGSLRVDGSTSYGDKYNPRPYPKVGLSWIASDEPWLRGLPGVDQLRFRYSFGASSRAPTSAMKLGRVTPGQVAIEGQTENVYQRLSFANPLLRPERTRESEYGMDLTLLQGLLDASVTGYQRRTTDQINDISQPNGLPFLQWVNVGDVSGHGVEANATYHAIRRPGWTMDVAMTYTYQTTKVIRLSPALPNQYSFYGGLVAGYPLGAIFGQRVIGVADTVGGGPDSAIVSNEVVLSDYQFLGVMSPPHTFTLAPSISLLHGMLRLSTLFDRQTGFIQWDPIINDSCADQGLCLAGILKSAPIMEQANAVARIQHVEPGDFTRWRELSITTTVPLNFVRWLKIGSAQVSLQGRNLGLWTKYKGPDPESQPGSNLTGFAGNGGAFGIPFPRTWSVRFDVLP